MKKIFILSFVILFIIPFPSSLYGKNQKQDSPVPQKRKLNWIEPITGMEFRWIRSACFSMGSDKKHSPAHKVCLSGFWIGKYEVTQGQYRAIMNKNPSRFNNKNNPVENVSFEDAMEFIAELNNLENNYRYEFSLPSEAQWEHACRGRGEKSIYPWKTGIEKNMANCGTCRTENYKASTLPVGSFRPNSFGLFDMAGNVEEWCLDVYEKKAYKNHDRNNPVNIAKGVKRVVRGGSFADNLSKLKCTSRKGVIKFMKTNYTGFRLVRIKKL